MSGRYWPADHAAQVAIDKHLNALDVVEAIEERAHEEGYEDVTEYLESIAEADAERRADEARDEAGWDL